MQDHNSEIFEIQLSQDDSFNRACDSFDCGIMVLEAFNEVQGHGVLFISTIAEQCNSCLDYWKLRLV